MFNFLPFDFTFTIASLASVAVWGIAAFLISFVLTPVIAKIAKYYGAYEEKSNYSIQKADTSRVNKVVIPRMGGVAIVISVAVMMVISQLASPAGLSIDSIFILLALAILTIVGIIDDKYDLHGSRQFIAQLLAVCIVVFGGVRITGIDLFGTFLALDIFSIGFELLNLPFQFVFPADLITIVWLMVIINAMNWVAGIDALEETMAVVAGFTLMLLSIKFDLPQLLVLTTIFTFATSGFLVFNFPPAKIYGGTVANTVLGLLIGVFAIKTDGKLTTSILILALPLVDFVWVLVGRVIKYKEFNPLKLMSISGRHHLHHRLMMLGFSARRVLLIEISLYCVFCVLAYYLAGFNGFAVALIAVFLVLFILFTIISQRIRVYPVYKTVADNEKAKPTSPTKAIPEVAEQKSSKQRVRHDPNKPKEKFVY